MRRSGGQLKPNRGLVWLAFLLAVFCGPKEAPGATVDSSRALSAAKGWLQISRSPLDAPLGTLGGIETFSDAQGTPLYHVVSLKPEGFVIVPADDLVEPIIAFAPSGKFVPSAENPLSLLLNHDLPRRMAFAKAPKAAIASVSTNRPANKWALLEGAGNSGITPNAHIPSIADVRVSPLIQTLWDEQTAEGVNACYNYYTPPYGDGVSSNYPCGCVATATVQLMRYWQYPVTSVGTSSFPVTILMSTGYVFQAQSLRGGDGLGGPYVWTNMPLTPSYGLSTLAQRKAIGALCADVAGAINMAYRATGSGAWMSGDALVNTFHYSNAIRYWTGNNFQTLSSTQLCAIVNPNLDAGCPVLLGIDPIGHAVACDGYGYNLSTLYHHLNFGWSGNFNAWYTLPDSASDFTCVPECVYNVWTNGTGEIISGRILYRDGSPIAGATVTAVRQGGGTYTATSNARGIYALAQIPSSSTYTVTVSKAVYTFTNQTVVTGFTVTNSPDAGNRWAIDFTANEGTLTSPAPFTATAMSKSQIDLSWSPNTSGDPVMVAWNTNAVFGAPAAAFNIGDKIPGGGIVLANGSGTNLSHTGLSWATPYYYQAWSVRAGTNFSSGLSNAATTLGCLPPTLFRVTPTNSSTLNLSWTPDASNDCVVVAWNTSPVFGTPLPGCAVDDPVPGGGTILYNGNATNVAHLNLAATTPYYYQAWSLQNGTNYSVPVSGSAGTSGRTVPFTEGFENSSAFFATWSQEFVTGVAAWGTSGNPHSGTASTSLYNPSGVKTRLVTPRLDFGTGSRNAQLSFWHYMKMYGTNQDALNVFYKTNKNASYILLASYTNNVPVWTNRTLSLPCPNSTYYIAFEGYAKGGYGIYLDDVAVTASYPASASFSAWALANCPGVDPAAAFAKNCPDSGIPNGLKFAFGTNWNPGLPLITLRSLNGAPVAEVPQSIPEAGPYISIVVETSTDLGSLTWQTNGLHGTNGPDKPANRNWIQRDQSGACGFFRLHGIFLE